MAPDNRTNLDADIELLSRVPLFTEMTPEQLRLLAFSLSRRELGPGEVLFRQGDKAESGFVIVFGEIELAVGEGESRQVVETCQRGVLLGELALLIETKRPATATAGTVSSVVEITRPLMIRLLNEFPVIAVAIRQRMAQRVGSTIGELQRVRDRLMAIDRGGQSR